MQLWVVTDGVKRGPYPDYEVRGRIGAGELGPETLGWHEGLEEWVPLGRMDLFEREFRADRATVPADVPASVPPGEAAVLVRGESFWIRRFLARWFDLQLYAALWWLGLYLANADIRWVMQDLWLMLLIYLPWVPLEAWWVSRVATTPGKWLMGLRVLNEDGGRLRLGQSIRRALRVYFLGTGLGWIPVAAVCHAVSWFHLKSTGRTFWDLHGGHRVEGVPWRWFRAPALVCSMYLVMRMQMMVISPYVVEEALKQYPQMREWFEKNPPEHFPERKRATGS